MIDYLLNLTRSFFAINANFFNTNNAKKIYTNNIIIIIQALIYIYCIPERFNINISHQLLDYKIVFVNSQNENTNSKGDLYSKTGLKRSL